jgi:Fe-S-cluster-containing dehydrogenase component/formate-dependent nitrite reductase membrane component NrfD
VTRFGFVIDHRKCIGCHACTLACKAENDVPLGAFRTWVKYIEKGEFPNTRRYFTVLRCNHCTDAPCVTICPTVALYKRPDGIVDFNGDRCIGCKSCMQACPYDALYIDPNTHTAAKCHYCAHRTEIGLQPACVVVCPEQAIISGDLEDPRSRIAQLVARETTSVRRPEQGTRPNVYYVGADDAALTPGVPAQPQSYLWAQARPADVSPDAWEMKGGRHGGKLRTVYDVAHPRPWGWRVGAYLWTKAIAAGALVVAALLLVLGQLVPALRVAPGPVLQPLLTVGAPILALVFLALTGGLLVADLKRPERFYYLFFKPNWSSWLVWGAWIIAAYGAVGVLWLLFGLARLPIALGLVAWAAGVLGLATAGYSAFLFGQAEGRDFWQSPLLLWHLLLGAVAAGAASLALVGLWLGASAPLLDALGALLAVAVVLGFLVALLELYGPHPNADVAEAAELLRLGPYAGRFWVGAAIVGAGLPLLLLAGYTSTGSGALLGVAAVSALGGLWVYEDTWVRAGQAVAMS